MKHPVINSHGRHRAFPDPVCAGKGFAGCVFGRGKHLAMVWMTVCGLLSAGVEAGTVVSVQFPGAGSGNFESTQFDSSIPKDTAAGAVPAVNWNNAPFGDGTSAYSETMNGLVEENGNPTTINLSIVAPSSWDSGGADPYTGDGLLMHGYLDGRNETNPVTLQFSGLNAFLSAQGASLYDVYVYIGNDKVGTHTDRISEYALSGAATGNGAFYCTPQKFGGVFYRVTSTNSTQPDFACAYAVFEDVTGDTFTLACRGIVAPDTNKRAPLCGVQIVVGKPVPPLLERPNILWLTSEDNSPFLGVYGDPVAQTPHLDALATNSLVYDNAFASAPVCSPSRFTLVTGTFPTAFGLPQHHRKLNNNTFPFQAFPEVLRRLGYFTTNNKKTDYNTTISGNTWDENGGSAHWNHRPDADTPFFSIFNYTVTHESSLHPAGNPITDPASVVLPPYHPDTEVFRNDWARYYDKMNTLDQQVNDRIQELKDAGLYEDTIIFYFSDHGGILPESKRFCWDRGLKVPLIVHFPPKFRHLAPAEPGERVADPVSFVDFGPTVLALAGVPIPAEMHGVPFMGPLRKGSQPYVYAFRGRMDETYDMMRAVRGPRYLYIRNYMPHYPYGRHVTYAMRMASYREHLELFHLGRLDDVQARFYQAKPGEELYDTVTDPYNIHNLAERPEYAGVLDEYRAANDAHILNIRDTGFMPEQTPGFDYNNSRSETNYPLAGGILETANKATEGNAANLSDFMDALGHDHFAVRYWGAVGCRVLREQAAPAKAALLAALSDPEAMVRIAAAEALCFLGEESQALAVLEDRLQNAGKKATRLAAANIFENLGEKALPSLAAIENARAQEGDSLVKQKEKHVIDRLKTYAGRPDVDAVTLSATNRFGLSWQSETNLFYQVESSPDLSRWWSETPSRLPGHSGELSHELPMADPWRFFRVSVFTEE